jgi:transposase
MQQEVTMEHKRKKPVYTLSFKQDAARLVLERGCSLMQASQNLGVSPSALGRWVKIEQGQAINPSSPNKIGLSEHNELLQLRKKVARLEEERDILKKAAVFFARETK